MELAESVPGFLKYEERPWRKQLLDTSTIEVIEILSPDSEQANF
jgi:hypothetical protein